MSEDDATVHGRQWAVPMHTGSQILSKKGCSYLLCRNGLWGTDQSCDTEARSAAIGRALLCLSPWCHQTAVETPSSFKTTSGVVRPIMRPLTHPPN